MNPAIGADRSALGALAIMAVLAAAAAPARAVADPRTERAREHFQLGDAYFKLEKYAGALQEFEQAYLAKPDPSFLYNIAQCHRLMGNRVEAVRFYRRYINEAPSAGNRAVAEKHIKELEASLAETPAGPAHTPPPVTPVPAAPALATAPSGMPAPAASAPPSSPAPQALALQARSPSDTDLSHTGATPEAPSPSASDDQPIYTRWWFWTGIGVVVVGGVVTALLLGGDPSCPAGRVCQ